ncbi:hypothetical protein [Oceaniradius stylonematis]|uniref:hypothetical protein n=1 Tax=Oceaniradius stylonematis TaxID=2184161 RepID=UPI00273FD284|nr:hypothetical protein [Oceaniradius stylonematis]
MLDEDGGVILSVEFKNKKPIDLLQLSESLGAIAESFSEFATHATGDPSAGNVRLYVREVRSGSIEADLVALAEQAQWLLQHKEVLGGFVANINDIVNYLLGRDEVADPPTKQEAKRISQIVEPVARDNAAQLNMHVNDGGTAQVHQYFLINSLEANALQNGAKRYLGPDLPSEFVARDELMTLAQMKNDPAAKTGDRGIIERLSKNAVKLQFLNESAKRQVLELTENPFQKVFRVDVNVETVDGKPARYQLLQVIEALDRPE